ncbi:MAG: GTP-binding protein [Eubacteriales bacterium]
MKKMILLSGTSAVGKTSLLVHILKGLGERHKSPAVCKIDCLYTRDGERIKELGYPCIVGLSGDICPDHFLVSNIPELMEWTNQLQSNTLLIETAGLCHRCSPATENMLAGCVVDCTSSSYAPVGFGPMLTGADFIVLTKIDLISQAEREIFTWQVKELNPTAQIFAIDSVAGYGMEPLVNWIDSKEFLYSDEDVLRFTMPAGVCSYCVGEKRVGSAWQQGVVGKIDFSKEGVTPYK